MRRRFLGGGGQKQHQSTTKNGGTSSFIPNNKKAADPPSSGGLLANRRSFTAADEAEGPKATDYSAVLAENKYATIGGGGRTKWPLMRGGGSEKALNTTARRVATASGSGGGGGGRPRSMGAAQMGVKCAARAANGFIEEAETAFGGNIDLLPPPPPPHANHHQLLLMSGNNNKSTAQYQHQQQMGATSVPMAPSPIYNQHHPISSNNRNSTGSTNSSQTSSGFESQSAKSSSSQQLAQSASSGSCSSTSAVALPHHQTNNPTTPLAQHSSTSYCSPTDPASPSSRLSSSAGSSTQGGRSSAYFSLSDGLDCSTVGPGGTLTAQQKRTKSHGAGGQCARVNIGEMMAKGIPEPEIFAEWLQRLCLPEYLALFLAQGYDLPTLARASPEDLTTLGITKPEDRKRLIQDIQCWRNVKDEWPMEMAKEASIREWLPAIGLKQYVDQFEQQGYLSVGELEELEAEDLEDIGVRKLGHIKRIRLALKKLKQAQANRADHRHLMSPSGSSGILSSTSTLRPCLLANSTATSSSSSSSSPSMTATLRRHSQPQQQQNQQNQPTTSGTTMNGPKLREQNGGQQQIHHVHFRNSSFGIEPNGNGEKEAGDKGPPRLNLYRTSQIIAQLPREPPPELLDEEDEKGANFFIGHIPPPPAPMPLSPTLPYANRPPPLIFGAHGSFSQPTTPRNVQKMFAPAEMANPQHFQFGGGQFNVPPSFHSTGGGHQINRRLQMDQILHGLNGELDGIIYSAREIGNGGGNGRR